MTSGDIQKELRRHFSNYEYKLQNTYVFNWECDFFGMSKSGYFIEVEIKISRGDFFKDFEKDKHKIFRDLSAGKKISVYNSHYYGKNGDVLVKNFQEIKIELDNFRPPYPSSLKEKLYRQIINGSEFLIENNRGYFRSNNEPDKKPFLTNAWADRLKIVKDPWRVKDLHAPATNIGYHKLDEINVPNQIYYAVPAGLIKLEELPPYAGLIEIGDYTQIIKRAPYMHKRKMDLDKILLKKFYNLHIYGRNYSDVPKTENV